MPRYKYHCPQCQNVKIIFHRIDEKCEEVCEVCESPIPLQKLVSTCFIKTVDVKTKDDKIGNVTIDHIEENREILKQQRKEAMEKEL